MKTLNTKMIESITEKVRDVLVGEGAIGHFVLLFPFQETEPGLYGTHVVATLPYEETMSLLQEVNKDLVNKNGSFIPGDQKVN